MPTIFHPDSVTGGSSTPPPNHSWASYVNITSEDLVNASQVMSDNSGWGSVTFDKKTKKKFTGDKELTEVLCVVCNKVRDIKEIVNKDSQEADKYLDFFLAINSYTICRECFEAGKGAFGPKPSFTCTHCGNRRNNMSELSGVCEECFNDYFRKCVLCNEYSPQCQPLMAADGNKVFVCVTCIKKEDIPTCRCCGNRYLGDGVFCPRCLSRVFRCPTCDGVADLPGYQVVYSLYDKELETSLTTCGRCAGRVYPCHTCGRRKDEAEIYQHNGKLVCTECYALATGLSRKRKHNYSPAYYHYSGKDKDNLYLGIENEVTVTTYGELNSLSMNKKVDKTMGQIMAEYGEKVLYFKHDGSIGGEPAHGTTGFEIVFQPHTFRALKTRDWYSLFSMGFKRDNTCGMHIHLSKNSFSTFHLFKFLNFIYTNNAFIQLTGEREYTHYCTPNNAKHTKKDAKAKRFKNRGPGESFRRQAVNLCNRDTVELRFFANAFTEAGFMKNIEFTHALFKFAQGCSAKDATSKSAFLKFVEKNNKYYSNLFDFYVDMAELSPVYGDNNVNA